MLGHRIIMLHVTGLHTDKSFHQLTLPTEPESHHCSMYIEDYLDAILHRRVCLFNTMCPL